MKKHAVMISIIGIAIIVLLGLFYSYHGRFINKENETGKVVLIMKTIERVSQFWISLERGAIQASEDFGLSIQVTGSDDEDNIDMQINLMDEVIKSKPDVILLAAADYKRLVAPVKDAIAAGIDVITVDSFIETDDAVCEIGTANYEIGRKLGQFIFDNTEKDSLVLIVSYVKESSTAIEREEGCRAVLGDDYRICGPVYNYNIVDTAHEDTLGMLRENPEISIVVALNEYSARGALRAIIDSGRSEDIFFVSVDSDYDIIHAIENGIIAATVVQKPYSMGYLSVKAAYELIEGKSEPSRIDTGSVLITLENMYEPANQKLLFPLE